jgi:hypothetical protein
MKRPKLTKEKVKQLAIERVELRREMDKRLKKMWTIPLKERLVTSRG